MGECVVISCESFSFGKNRDIFMAAICDMAKGRKLFADISLGSFMIE